MPISSYQILKLTHFFFYISSLYARHSFLSSYILKYKICFRYASYVHQHIDNIKIELLVYTLKLLFVGVLKLCIAIKKPLQKSTTTLTKLTVGLLMRNCNDGPRTAYKMHRILRITIWLCIFFEFHHICHVCILRYYLIM